MNKSHIAKKFSKALINTVDISIVPNLLEELKMFSSLIDSDRKIKLLFVSQIFTTEEKNRVLKNVTTHLNFSSHTEKFLNLLLAEGVISVIKEIIATSDSMYHEKVRKVTAEVSAPVALDEASIKRLKSALGSLTNKEVDIDSNIDTSLIGGFIVKVGSTIYDSSIKGQLKLLKAELTK
ncbi:MAG: ATP synthase F1 subunit delta [Thermodesulfovibrionia bacterium]|nr:ATP synthase F1 subunit delta [Thermodesulfovibrionia bacterium]